MYKLQDLRSSLLSKQNYNHKLIQLASTELEKIKISGRLRIGHSNGSVQYFQCTDKSCGRGQYIRKENKKIVRALANKEYYEKIIRAACKQNEWIEKTIEKMPKEDLHDIYQKNEERRKLITPYFLTDEEYVQHWESITYSGKPFEEGSAEIYSEKGGRVRSKSEKIIADKLYKMGIPYRYEYPLYIKGFGTIYPDFTVLNKSKRKEIILEHFGMMDDSKYCAAVLSKLTSYESNGFYIGDNLIVSYETSVNPLNTKLLHKKLEKYFI